MTYSDIILIKRTWRFFREMDPLVVGDAFYSKLFSHNQSLRKMFQGKMDQQYIEADGYDQFDHWQA